MTGAILATVNNTPIIGQVAQLFGIILNWIFNLGIHNLGVCIILFTIIVYMLQLPLTIQQQKFSRMQMVMNPEIQAIQKKYRDKKDQASQLKMQEETRAVYDKYGVSMSSGCLPLFIQLPILYGFFRVINNIPAYLPAIKNLYTQNGLVDIIKGGIAEESWIEFAKTAGVRISAMTDNTIIDVLWKLHDKTWMALKELGAGVSGIADAADKTYAAVKQYTIFCGLNIAESPMGILTAAWANKNIGLVIVAILIPILSGATQFLTMKLMPQSGQKNSEDPTARSMQTMNYTMPLISVVFCFTLPFGIGIYWIMSAVIRAIQQIAINRYYSKIDVNKIIEKNKEKAARKQEKRSKRIGQATQNLEGRAKTNTRNIRSGSTSNIDSPAQKGEPKAGSLAAKANMVKKFNESQKKEK